MQDIQKFVRSGGHLTDDELSVLMRERLSATPEPQRRNWLHQLELSLDGYGGERQLHAIERVKSSLKILEKEFQPT
jgi:hypothetical protein